MPRAFSKGFSWPLLAGSRTSKRSPFSNFTVKNRKEKFFPMRGREGRRKIFFLVRSFRKEEVLLFDFFKFFLV